MKHISIAPQTINAETVNAVNSRDIYKNLDLAKGQYSRWFKKAVKKYDFKEDEDYICIDTKVEGTMAETFFVTMDMAKELCMISNTEKGKEYRKYFIKVEKQSVKPALLENPMEDIIKALTLTAEGLRHQDERLDDQNQRITDLEENKRMESWQEKSLLDAHNKRVYEIAKEYGVDSTDKSLVSKLHRKTWKLFKDKFSLPRYSELSCGRYEAGLDFIQRLSMKDMV